MTAPLRFRERTPCMDDPPLFDREIDDETPSESNARMKRAAQICKTACQEIGTCAALYQGKKSPPGVVAGRYNLRYTSRKHTKADQ